MPGKITQIHAHPPCLAPHFWLDCLELNLVVFDLLAGLLIDHLLGRNFNDILTLSADSCGMWREIEWFFTMG